MRNYARTNEVIVTPTLKQKRFSVHICFSFINKGMDICRDLYPRKYVERDTKASSGKLSVLNKVRRFFSHEHLCFLYKTQFRSCVEYGSHHCDGTAQYLYDALGRLQRQAIRIFNSHEGMRQTSMHIMSWHTDMEYSKN